MSAEIPPAENTTPPGTTIPAAASTPQILLGAAESLVKATAIALGIAAAMGLPAVNLQYTRYSIPTALITYDEILRAGALPTIALIILGLYLYWVRKESSSFTPGGQSPWLLQLAFWPIFLPISIVMLTAAIGMYALMLWGFVWVATRPLGIIFGIDMSNRDVLVGAAVLVVLAFCYLAWKIWRDDPSVVAATTVVAERDATGRTKPANPAVYYMAMFARSPREVPVWVLLASLLIFVVAFIMCALALKMVLYLWDPAWSATFTYGYALRTAVVVSLLTFATMILSFALEWLRDADRSKRIFGLIAVSVILGAAYLSLTIYYSYSIYPRIPRGFGGGRPDRVVVWVNGDVSPGLLPSGASCAPSSATVLRCEGLSVFLMDDEKVVLVTRPGATPGGVLLSKDRIQAISW